MNTNGSVLQRNISKVFPNKVTSTTAEIIVMFLMGALAMFLHARLRIPMHLPGKNGLIFMMLVVSTWIASGYRFGAIVICLGSASMLLVGKLGFSDPFMPVVYIFLGFFIDLLLGFAKAIKFNLLTIALASGLSWMMIPLIRTIVSSISGFAYNSLTYGLFYPFFTHFIFGLSGGLIGGLMVYTVKKTREHDNE
jgi:hypothetical protein